MARLYPMRWAGSADGPSQSSWYLSQVGLAQEHSGLAVTCLGVGTAILSRKDGLAAKKTALEMAVNRVSGEPMVWVQRRRYGLIGRLGVRDKLFQASPRVDLLDGGNASRGFISCLFQSIRIPNSLSIPNAMPDMPCPSERF